MLRAIIATILTATLAHTAHADAPVIYLSQNRFVEAHAESRWLEFPDCEDEEGNVFECPPHVDHERFSASDFALFDATASASEGGGDYSSSSYVIQRSSFAADSIHATLSFWGSSSAGDPGSGNYSFWSTATTSLSTQFRLTQPSTVDFEFDLTAVIFGQYGEPWDDLAHVRLATMAGDTIFDSRDSELPDDRFNQQVATTFTLPAGDYQVDAYLRGGGLNSAYFGDDGRMDMELTMAFEAISVPEPSGCIIACTAAIAACIASGSKLRKRTHRRASFGN